MLEKFIVEPIMSNAELFSRKVFNSLVPFSHSLLAGLLLLWITWTAYNALIEGKFELLHILKKILIFVVIGTMLTANNKIFYEYIYDPIKQVTNDLVNNILTISPQFGSKQFTNSKQAIEKIDFAFSDLVSLVTLISKKANFAAVFFTAIVTFVIWGLFIMSEAIFALYLVGNTLKLAAISALSPLLIVAFAFEQTRSHAIGGLKYVLASALTLLVASFCMALILLALRKFVLDLNVETLPANQVCSALSALLILALSSVYFLKLAPEIASVIMGVSNSSILSGVIGGAMAGAIGVTWGGALNKATTVAAAVATNVDKPPKFAKKIVLGVYNNLRTQFAANYKPSKV